MSFSSYYFKACDNKMLKQNSLNHCLKLLNENILNRLLSFTELEIMARFVDYEYTCLFQLSENE